MAERRWRHWRTANESGRKSSTVELDLTDAPTELVTVRSSLNFYSYCDTFDRGKANCLNLFDHVYGESRDRGQAMSDLLDVYRAVGLESRGAELPDYLPLYLEYLSRLDPVTARDQLCDSIEIVAVLEARLRQRGSPYAAVMAALVSLSRKKINQREIDAAAANTPDDRSFEAIDADWEEAAAFEGEPETPCPQAVAPGGEQPIHFVANARGTQA